MRTNIYLGILEVTVLGYKFDFNNIFFIIIIITVLIIIVAVIIIVIASITI